MLAALPRTENLWMKFDDAEYYFLDFESDLPNEAGGIPMGMYLAWMAGRQLLSAGLAGKLALRQGREESWTERLFDLCDGKLMSDDFNEVGEAFTRHYYTGYARDYIACLGITDDSADGVCRVPESPENLAKVSQLLDRRWIEWRVEETTRAPAPKPTRPTVASVIADLTTMVVPELVADGFSVLPAPYDEVLLVRRVGGVGQYFRIALLERSESVSASYWFRFGCGRLRQVWLGLLDPALRENPPTLYGSDFSKYGDLEAEEWNLTGSGHLMGEYIKRFEGQPQVRALETLALYRERLKPVLDGASNAKALALIAQTGMQMTRQRSHMGRIRGVELLGRIVLFGAYTDLLTGASAATMRKELLAQWDFGGVYRQDPNFPDRGIIERLLDTVVKPGFAEKARAFLEA
jgi:hypothetical protein